MARLTPSQRHLRHTALARRDNAMVCYLRRHPQDTETLTGFYMEHGREWPRLLNRLTAPNRKFIIEATAGLDAQ
jgi:hypothetical protein